ncbi:hypothetical protein [Streptomyces cylindrosporus]|uniref:Uncharacterized protein n=1 Tax=Streptomyces cylindrosporus TaxID=2927583 RepID=A0ABS9Y9A3_9ACTN|nr:hypothetical protein [Streptomyces cylindrosporus]MCI3273808.1 hypothetical protein [Streptomyces cylindrosporus]
MPIRFLVAGLGARHSLRRRGPGGLALERLLRRTGTSGHASSRFVVLLLAFCLLLLLFALPLYVLHQPVVVAFAYGVVGWRVRRTRVTRFLFGRRP